MAVEVDYYAILGIGRTAQKEAVEAAVKKSMREWRKRTEAADLSVRQEAELKVKWIEEARATLLDESKRRAYDADLAGGEDRVRERRVVRAVAVAEMERRGVGGPGPERTQPGEAAPAAENHRQNFAISIGGIVTLAIVEHQQAEVEQLAWIAG